MAKAEEQVTVAVEHLEQRIPLTAVDCTFCDVHPVFGGGVGEWGDGEIVPADVLSIINRINEVGLGPVSSTERVDVTFDGFLSPADPLRVINFLNCEPEASTILQVGIQQLTGTHGLTADQSWQAVRDGINRISEVADVGFEFTSFGAGANHVNIQFATAYVGGGVHAGGIFRNGSITLHSGHIPGGTHSCRQAPCGQAFDMQVFGEASLRNVAQHEFLHSLGFGHIGVNPPHVMSPGATSDVMSPGTIAQLRRIFNDGISGGPGVDAIDLTFLP